MPRLWVKTKSAAWPRRELEREAFAKARERRRARVQRAGASGWVVAVAAEGG
jgi:hypothetical protein